MTEIHITDRQRARLAALADALIPAAEGHLSASAAGIAGPLLDRVALHAPERLVLLLKVVDDAGDTVPEAALAALKADDRARFDAFCETIAAAYFMAPAVRRQIGFPGRDAVPARVDVTEMEDLLMPVFESDFAPRAVPRRG